MQDGSGRSSLRSTGAKALRFKLAYIASRASGAEFNRMEEELRDGRCRPKDFQGATVRAVDHPRHGELLMSLDVLRALGYSVASNGSLSRLHKLGVPNAGRTFITRSMLANSQLSDLPNRGATFLTRTGVNAVLMTCTLPKAQEFRDWLAGDVVNAIVDTGGYLLNEAARDTAKADTRTSVPLPEEIGGAYAALIEARRAELDARGGVARARVRRVGVFNTT